MITYLIIAIFSFGLGWSLRKPWLKPTLTTDMTPVQRFVLMELSKTGESSGRELRVQAERNGMPCNGPEFYDQMAHIENKGYIKGWDEETYIRNQCVLERRYRITL